MNVSASSLLRPCFWRHILALDLANWWISTSSQNSTKKQDLTGWNERWDYLDAHDYDELDPEELVTEISWGRAICYEDIRLVVLQDPSKEGRNVLAMEVTLSHHKGSDFNSKPYVPFPFSHLPRDLLAW